MNSKLQATCSSGISVDWSACHIPVNVNRRTIDRHARPGTLSQYCLPCCCVYHWSFPLSCRWCCGMPSLLTSARLCVKHHRKNLIFFSKTAGKRRQCLHKSTSQVISNKGYIDPLHERSDAQTKAWFFGVTSHNWAIIIETPGVPGQSERERYSKGVLQTICAFIKRIRKSASAGRWRFQSHLVPMLHHVHAQGKKWKGLAIQ